MKTFNVLNKETLMEIALKKFPDDNSEDNYTRNLRNEHLKLLRQTFVLGALYGQEHVSKQFLKLLEKDC